MASNVYHFEEHWTIPDATPAEVWRVIADANILPEWWRGVYLESEPLGHYTKPEVGARFRVKARGFLPYKLRFILECTNLEPDRMVEVKATGDFIGVWRAVVAPYDNGARVDTNWQVSVEKPLIRWLSPLLKPVFVWNHRWTTPRGENGLRAYIAEHKHREALADQSC